MIDDTGDWTPAERERFVGLERTIPIDPAQEERTVRALRAEGLLIARREEGRLAGRPGVRPLRVALAIAAGLGCFLAGRWSERAGLWGGNAGAIARGTSASAPLVLADSQRHAPVIRF